MNLLIIFLVVTFSQMIQLFHSFSTCFFMNKTVKFKQHKNQTDCFKMMFAFSSSWNLFYGVKKNSAPPFLRCTTTLSFFSTANSPPPSYPSRATKFLNLFCVFCGVFGTWGVFTFFKRVEGVQGYSMWDIELSMTLRAMWGDSFLKFCSTDR